MGDNDTERVFAAVVVSLLIAAVIFLGGTGVGCAIVQDTIQRERAGWTEISK